MRPKKKISQKDIANALGVSNVTVSNALAGRKGVSDDLIRKVRRTAAEMGYEAGKTDAGKETGGDADDGSKVVLIVTPTDGAAGGAERFAGFLETQRFRARYCTVDEISGGEGGGKFDPENCAGILLPVPLAAEDLLFLRERSGGPVVGIGFFDSRVPLDYVADDGFHGAQLMAQYLRERGYEKILYVKPEEDASVTDAQRAMWEDRLLGCRSERYLETLNRGLAMEQAQPFDLEETQGILTLPETKAYLRDWQAGVRGRADDRGHASDRGQKDGRERTGDQGQADGSGHDGGAEHPRTAFFCGDMRTARALLDYLAERRIAVPEEFGVAGYLAGGESEPQETDCRRPDWSLSGSKETGREQAESEQIIQRRAEGRKTGREQPGQEQAESKQIGQEPSAQGRITACENCEERLLAKCCEIFRSGRAGRERAGDVYLVTGEIAVGRTT